MSKDYNELKKEYRTLQKIERDQLPSLEGLNLFLDNIKASPFKEISQISRSEIKRYDEQWINYLESAVTAITQIVNNPKRSLKGVRNIVPVELAKKISSESVMHLSQHSQFVKEVDKNNNVIPSKILTVEADDEYAIYENRFVKSLIDKLIIFCRKRYEYMKDHNETKDTDILEVKTKTVVNGVTFEYYSKIKISQPSQDAGKKEYNEELFKKITMLVERVNFFKTTEFYRLVGETKPVKNPILQTNIIVKNQNYKACYEVWKFLDKYDQLGINIKVVQKDCEFSEEYLDRLLTMSLMSTMTLETEKLNDLLFDPRYSTDIKPKLNKEIVDPDLDNTKFDLSVLVGRDQLTDDQIQQIERHRDEEDARRRKEEEKKRLAEENKRRKKEAKHKRKLEILMDKERMLERKRREKERRIFEAIQNNERLKERKRIKQEQEEARRRLLDEKERLRRTRIVVRKVAKDQENVYVNLDQVTDDIVETNKVFDWSEYEEKEHDSSSHS